MVITAGGMLTQECLCTGEIWLAQTWMSKATVNGKETRWHIVPYEENHTAQEV